MGEKLIIKNFGPIKEAEFDFRRINVLIGEQATGKTMVAKLLAMCRYFSYLVSKTGYDSDFEQGLYEWGLEDCIKKNSLIKYECEDYNFTASRQVKQTFLEAFSNKENSKDSLDFFEIALDVKSLKFEALLNELETITPSAFEQLQDEEINWRIPASFFQNNVSKVLDNPFFLPAERGLQSIFSLGKSSIKNINDALFNQFARIDQIQRLFSSETEIEPLGILYRNVNGKGYFRMQNEGKWYSMANAPSGFQTAVPLILLLKYYTGTRRKKKTFLIEEPELSLYPAAQQKLVQYLVGEAAKLGSSFFINTHSPYILASLNNLLYSYIVGQDYHDKINKVILKQNWLNPSEFSAYKLLPNGSVKNVVDEELKQIAVEEIDEISDILSDEWHKLAGTSYESGS